MLELDSHPSGRHFLQIPGPTNVPDRVLRAIDHPTIDHRGPEFGKLGKTVLAGMKRVFQTEQDVIIYPASGTGAWEAALVNTLSPGDRVLMAETGQFATLWKKLAERLQLVVDFMPGDWRQGANPAEIEKCLRADNGHAIKAVCVVHNETSTGVTTPIAPIRAAVDVTVGGSQKGLMLPPGLSFNAISRKAMEASASAKLPRSYWDWKEMLAANVNGYFPYTPATNLLYGLHEALDMLFAEGLPNVFRRHDRFAEAARRAVRAWGLEILCVNPAEYSSALTAVLMPDGHNADAFRKIVLERFDMSLGQGLGKVSGKIFRIGHLGYFNDLMLCGTLAGVEMGLALAGVPHRKGGVDAAMAYLAESPSASVARAA
jgi:alanine-glyoxylate transaminase/serine-glyoxylate transaminase/serine-pyruvate transaminase